MFHPAIKDRVLKDRAVKSGLPAGSLIYVGDNSKEKFSLNWTRYGPGLYEEKTYEEAGPVLETQPEDGTLWLDVTGVNHVEAVKSLGERFGLHPLLLEDVLNTDQRPKLDVYDDHLFLIVKMMYYSPEHQRINYEQVSIVVGEDFLITFQELAGDAFQNVRKRIRDNQDNFREQPVDFLLYALLDALVDGYFEVMEIFSEKLEFIEMELLDSVDTGAKKYFHLMKFELIFMRKSVNPVREVIRKLTAPTVPFLSENTRLYLSDVRDHTEQALDMVESFREMLNTLLEVYMSNVNTHMNKVMQTLTIVSTIFIPLTFIVGLYGMNFDHMPEYHYKWAYPAVWAVMGGVAVGMLIFFRRKKWL